jgi:hypothetical protein
MAAMICCADFDVCAYMHAVSTSICDKVLVLHARPAAPAGGASGSASDKYATEQAKYDAATRAAAATKSTGQSEGGQDACVVSVFTREADEESAAFFLRIKSALQQPLVEANVTDANVQWLPPCVCPHFETLGEHVAAYQDVIVFGGEIEDYAAIAKAVIPAAKKTGFAGKLSVVNLRGADRAKKVCQVDVDGEEVQVVSIVGWDVLNYLARI